MKYEVLLQQQQLFQKEKTISFEQFLPFPLTERVGNNLSYNNWKRYPEIAKIVTHKGLGSIIFQLTNIFPVRLLFDTMILKKTIHLKKISFSEVLIGVLIPLDSCSLILFSPDFSYTIEDKHLLIAYGQSSSRYQFKKEDPFPTSLKKQGYASGDVLSPKDFPFIFK